MRNAVIVSAVRTAVGKAPRGSLRTVRPDDMAAEVGRALRSNAPAWSRSKWRMCPWAARFRRRSRA